MRVIFDDGRTVAVEGAVAAVTAIKRIVKALSLLVPR